MSAVLGLVLGVLAVAAFGAPATALAGGDETQAPPSAGPRGPWDDREVGEGEDRPYRPTDARQCRLGKTRSAGPGSVLGVWVVGTRCRRRTRVVRRYQRCLNSAAGRKGRCYRRVDMRCVRPIFLGRCWMRDRFFRRRVGRYRCTERRAYEVRGLYEGRVLCRYRTDRISHRYTLLPEGPVAVNTESELRAAWSNPRVTAIDVTANIFLRACELGDPLRESARPVLLDGHGHTLRQTCFEKRLLRSDGTGFVELQQRDAHARRQRRAGRRRDHQGRDHAGRLQGAREPRRGAGRRDHVPAPGDDRPLDHHRKPRERRRRRRVRAPRRHPGLRLDRQREPRRRVGRRARLDRRHPRRALARRRQHDRRRRRRDLHGRGRRRDGDRLDRERQRRGRPGRRDLHSRRGRHDRQLDRERQPRRRSGRRRSRARPT